MNYISIKEVLSRDKFRLLGLMLRTKISAGLYQQFFREAYNQILTTQSPEDIKLLYEHLGAKFSQKKRDFEFNRAACMGFLDQIPSLECYNQYFKEIMKTEKGERQKLFNSIFGKIHKNYASFEFLSFLRKFFVCCDKRCITLEKYSEVAQNLIRLQQNRQTEPFLSYISLSIALEMMRFNPSYFKKNFLVQFFNSVLSLFRISKDQRFMAVVSDFINFYKPRVKEKDDDLERIVDKSVDRVVSFFRRRISSNRYAKWTYKTSEFLNVSEISSNRDGMESLNIYYFLRTILYICFEASISKRE